MASSHKLNDPATAGGAVSGANQATQTATGLSSQANSNAQALQAQLFGPNGSMTKLADPNNLNVTGPTGADKIALTTQNEQLAKDTSNAEASSKQAATNAGFGAGTPSGFSAGMDQSAKLAEADQRGANFNAATNNSYNKASTNFWNAANAQNANNTQQSGLAAQTNANAGQIQNSLYGTAGQGYQQQSTAGAILGDTVGAAGQVGAAALTCVTTDTLIRMNDRSEREARNITVGDELFGLCGPEKVEAVENSMAPVFRVITDGGQEIVVSGSHTFAAPFGGYVEAFFSQGRLIKSLHTQSRVTAVIPEGEKEVIRFRLSNVHGFLTNGLWSLE